MLIRKTLWTKSVEKQLRAVGRSWCWRNCFTDTQAFRTNKQTLPTSLAWGNVLHLFCQYSLHRIFLVNFIVICKWRKSTAYALWKHLSSHLASDARSSALLRQKFNSVFLPTVSLWCKDWLLTSLLFSAITCLKNLTQALHLSPTERGFFSSLVKKDPSDMKACEDEAWSREMIQY